MNWSSFTLLKKVMASECCLAPILEMLMTTGAICSVRMSRTVREEKQFSTNIALMYFSGSSDNM